MAILQCQRSCSSGDLATWLPPSAWKSGCLLVPVCTGIALGVPAAGARLRLGHDLLAAAAGLASGRNTGEAAPVDAVTTSRAPGSARKPYLHGLAPPGAEPVRGRLR